MQVIQDLQGRRSEIVYVFDGVVSTLTDGTVYTSLSRRENQITLTGQAENNNRISSLMRSIDGADWFTDPNLTKVIAEKSGELPNRFDLSIALTNPVSEAQQ
nr:PilN domain-containing protein [Litorivicinus lipolyticus]